MERLGKLVKEFLETDDFLLTSFNHFNMLGLGLTQMYHQMRVYNRRLEGEFILDRRSVKFCMVEEFPKTLTAEYLLVDFLNNHEELPDDNVSRALRILRVRFASGELKIFNLDKLKSCLNKYGTAEAKEFFQKARRR